MVASYEDECFIFSGNVYRRFTSIGGDNGATTVLLQITLKTVGTFGFHAF
jgi:LPS-assembly protein